MKDMFKLKLVKNKSLTYLLPLIDSEIKLEQEQNLMNCYISFDKNDDTFCLMYKWSSSPDFLKYEGKLMAHPMYIGHADFGENVVYKFQLTNVMRRGRSSFIEGKYKEFSDAHKKAIEDYMKKMGYNNLSRIRRILDKNDDLKSDAPDMSAETVSNNIHKLVIEAGSPFSDDIPSIEKKVVKGFGN